MPPQPTPSDFDARTNAVFDAVMWAMARPGLPRTLPDAGLGQILEALIDRECAVYSDSPELTDMATKAGAAIVEIQNADHLFLRQFSDAGILRRISLGSDLYPETGTTLVTEADFGSGDPIRLSGPGIDGSLDVNIGSLPSGFWTERRSVMRYPMGFELIFVDKARVLGVPRSTLVELL